MDAELAYEFLIPYVREECALKQLMTFSRGNKSDDKSENLSTF